LVRSGSSSLDVRPDLFLLFLQQNQSQIAIVIG